MVANLSSRAPFLGYGVRVAVAGDKGTGEGEGDSRERGGKYRLTIPYP